MLFYLFLICHFSKVNCLVTCTSGTDFNVKKHSNRAGTFVDVVLRLRSTSLVKMVTAGVRHERRKVRYWIPPHLWIEKSHFFENFRQAT